MVDIWKASVRMEGGNGQKIVLLPLLGYWYYVAFVQLVLYPYIIGALEASVGVH